MNEGHSSLLAIELLTEQAQTAGRGALTSDHIAAVRQKCVFTTHTPVHAGQDLGVVRPFDCPEQTRCQRARGCSDLAGGISAAVPGTGRCAI
jgi:hypothetical protein